MYFSRAPQGKTLRKAFGKKRIEEAHIIKWATTLLLEAHLCTFLSWWE